MQLINILDYTHCKNSIHNKTFNTFSKVTRDDIRKLDCQH